MRSSLGWAYFLEVLNRDNIPSLVLAHEIKNVDNKKETYDRFYGYSCNSPDGIGL